VKYSEKTGHQYRIDYCQDVTVVTTAKYVLNKSRVEKCFRCCTYMQIKLAKLPTFILFFTLRLLLGYWINSLKWDFVA